MTICSMSPITIECEFHGAAPSGGPLTRQELARLAREAAKAVSDSKEPTH